jgi:PAS domain S-box-containing protein
MVLDLTENAIARVTLYDIRGNVIASSLTTDQTAIQSEVQESSEQYQRVMEHAEDQVPTRSITIKNQNYLLAYGDWRLRGQSFGMYSVALPSNFIVNAAATSRNSLSLIFSLATMGVFAIGYTLAQRIVTPLNRLVSTSTAVAKGNLHQRTGIERGDEIGVLAKSFDNMTQTLETRNEQLIEQASNLSTILESITDGVIVLDQDNQISTTNPAAEQILRDVIYSNTNEETPTQINILHNEKVAEWINQVSDSAQALRHKVGNRVFGAITSPVIKPDGTQFGSVIVMRDITREVEAEERQNVFLTNVSHELRTPLTSVKGYISLMLSAGEDSLGEQFFGFAKTIDKNTNLLVEHVNRLLEIAEIQTGTLKLNQERTSITQLLKETTQTWEEKMENKDISYQLDLSKDDIWIVGDPIRLDWSIDNILQNAYDYTSEGGSVSIRLYKDDMHVHISVTDTGIGINATDQALIFERFFRAENELTIQTPGMGLGLFVVRFIIEGHGGSVTVSSQPEKGSTFQISLPLEMEVQVKHDT